MRLRLIPWTLFFLILSTCVQALELDLPLIELYHPNKTDYIYLPGGNAAQISQYESQGYRRNGRVIDYPLSTSAPAHAVYGYYGGPPLTTHIYLSDPVEINYVVNNGYVSTNLWFALYNAAGSNPFRNQPIYRLHKRTVSNNDHAHKMAAGDMAKNLLINAGWTLDRLEGYSKQSKFCAEFVGQSVPNSMFFDRSYSVWVDMKNSCGHVWRNGSGKLQVKTQHQDNDYKWGIESVYVNRDVQVGETYRFAFTVVPQRCRYGQPGFCHGGDWHWQLQNPGFEGTITSTARPMISVTEGPPQGGTGIFPIVPPPAPPGTPVPPNSPAPPLPPTHW